MNWFDRYGPGSDRARAIDRTAKNVRVQAQADWAELKVAPLLRVCRSCAFPPPLPSLGKHGRHTDGLHTDG